MWPAHRQALPWCPPPAGAAASWPAARVRHAPVQPRCSASACCQQSGRTCPWRPLRTACRQHQPCRGGSTSVSTSTSISGGCAMAGRAADGHACSDMFTQRQDCTAWRDCTILPHCGPYMCVLPASCTGIRLTSGMGTVTAGWLVRCAPDDISVERLVGHHIECIRLLLPPLLRLLLDLQH